METTRIVLKPGDHLWERLEDWVALQGPIHGFVLQAMGYVNPIRIKLPGSNRIYADHGPYVIAAMQAHLTQKQVLVHVLFMGAEGKPIGGRLEYGTVIAAPTEIVLGYLPIGLLPVDSFFSKFTENQ
jgi:predicted DNA-binding protein with PD1-like motif